MEILVLFALQSLHTHSHCSDSGPATTLYERPKAFAMRSYPRNSPEAAARIVALVLIVDGHVCRSEYEALTRLDATGELGLGLDGLPRVVQTLCEDLQMASYCSGSLLDSIDKSLLTSLMAEITEPALQDKVLRLAVAAAQADRHHADAEAVVLEVARRHWRLQDSAVPD